MSSIVGILGIALPVLTFFVSPTRTIGRGGKWVLVGAALFVGTMMLFFFDVRDLSSELGAAPTTASSNALDADAAALASLFAASP